MKTRPSSAALTAALVAVTMLLAAVPAAADAVRRQQLNAPVSGKLASGFSSFVAGDNLKETSDLRPESWWGYDSSWNRYAYVENNPLRSIDPDGRTGLEVALVAPKVLTIPAPPPILVGAAGLGIGYKAGRVLGRSEIVSGDTVDEFYTDLFYNLLFNENTKNGESTTDTEDSENERRVRELGDSATEGTAGEAIDDLESLEDRQKRIRERRAKGIIETTGKSNQRVKHRLDRIDTLEDAVNEFD